VRLCRGADLGRAVHLRDSPVDQVSSRWSTCFSAVHPCRLLCPYNRNALDPAIVEQAHVTHPQTVEDGTRHRQPRIPGPGRVSRSSPEMQMSPIDSGPSPENRCFACRGHWGGFAESPYRWISAAYIQPNLGAIEKGVVAMPRLIRLDRTGHTELASWTAEDAGRAASGHRGPSGASWTAGCWPAPRSLTDRRRFVRELPLDADLVVMRRPIAGG